VLQTDNAAGLEGHGLTLLSVAAMNSVWPRFHSLKPLVAGVLSSVSLGYGGLLEFYYRRLSLRWVGPEKGVIHLANAALVNAVWDLYAKVEGKPLWKLLADMTPEQIVSCVPFSYITDVLTPTEALEILTRHRATRRRASERCSNMVIRLYHIGRWIGYSDGDSAASCAKIGPGWTHFKMKVGRDLAEDMRRAEVIREEIGWGRTLMMDANQVWDVGEAIRCIKELSVFRLMDRGAHFPRRRTGPCDDRSFRCPYRSCHWRTLSQPRDVQATAASRCDKLLSDR